MHRDRQRRRRQRRQDVNNTAIVGNGFDVHSMAKSSFGSKMPTLDESNSSAKSSLDVFRPKRQKFTPLLSTAKSVGIAMVGSSSSSGQKRGAKADNPPSSPFFSSCQKEVNPNIKTGALVPGIEFNV